MQPSLLHAVAAYRFCSCCVSTTPQKRHVECAVYLYEKKCGLCGLHGLRGLDSSGTKMAAARTRTPRVTHSLCINAHHMVQLAEENAQIKGHPQG